MKIIRANRGLYIPVDPENKESVVRLVNPGLIALIPDDFQLPKGSYKELAKVNVKKDKNNQAEV